MSFEHFVGENMHRYPMSLTSLECQVSELVNSDTCLRPGGGGRGRGPAEPLGLRAKRGSADQGVKGFLTPPERLLTSFHTVFMVPFGDHLPSLPSR